MSANKQRGNTLLVSLMLMLVFTVIGMSSVSNVGFNQKMTVNQRESDLAFQAAESALLEGEAYATNISANIVDSDFGGGCTSEYCFDDACGDGRCFNGAFPANDFCTLDEPDEPVYKDEDIWTSNTTSRPSALNFPELEQQPRYLVEFLCFVLKDPAAPTPTPSPGGYQYSADFWSYYYRVTSYAVGSNGTSRVMLQSTFKVNRN